MDFKEFTNKLEQDLCDAMEYISPGASIKVIPVKKLQDRSYTGIIISPVGTNIGVGLDADKFFDLLKKYCCRACTL